VAFRHVDDVDKILHNVLIASHHSQTHHNALVCSSINEAKANASTKQIYQFPQTFVLCCDLTSTGCRAYQRIAWAGPDHSAAGLYATIIGPTTDVPCVPIRCAKKNTDQTNDNIGQVKVNASPFLLLTEGCICVTVSLALPVTSEHLEGIEMVGRQ
jgi:hypothetical protein